MGGRSYYPREVHFVGADEPLADQHPEDPQSWNLYTYTRNNPLKYVDPTGTSYKICDIDGKCEEKSDDEFLKNYQKNNAYFLANGTIYQRTAKGTQGAMVGTYSFSGQELSAAGASLVEDLGSRANASNQMIGIVAGGSAAVGAGAALAPVAGQVLNEAAFEPAVGRVFYHFSIIAAAGEAGRIIDASRAGRLLQALPLPDAVRGFGWTVRSLFWASGAAGTVSVFPETGRRAGDLYKTELPRLISNPFVHSIRYR